MKYYKNKTDNRRRLREKRIAALPIKQKRQYRIKTTFEWFCVALFFIVFAAVLSLAQNMRKIISNDVWSKILNVVAWVLLIPFPVAVAAGVASLVNKVIPEVRLPSVTNEMIAAANKNKFKFYDLSDDYVITKCYCSGHGEMVNRDVLIVYSEGKIKITNDFYHSIFDFGCYECDIDEMKLKNVKDGNLVKTEINVGAENFIFGYQTKTFIDRYKQ